VAEFAIAIGVVVVLILIGMPVALAFGATAIFYGLLTGTDISYHAQHAFAELGAFSLLALPLFVLSGVLMRTSGISDRILDFIDAIAGHLKSGLGAVTVLTCMFFGAISGSAAAAIAAIGTIMVPRMEAAGYPHGYPTALIAVSSVLALMIPPSIPMIVFAIAIREPVSYVFLATMLPGILLALVYCVLNYRFLRNVTTIAVRERARGLAFARGLGRATWRGAFALATPVLILGSIYSGAATPSEAGGIALVYTLVVGFLVYRVATVKQLFRDTVEAGALTGAVAIVLFSLFIMSRGMVLTQVPSQLADLLLALSENRVVILLLVNVLLLLMGMIMDDISGGLLAAIILAPLMEQIGVDPLHFAAIVGTNLGMGNITPPCAPLLYIAGGVSGLSVPEYLGWSMKFILLGHLPIVLAVTFIPELSLWIPGLLT